MWWNGWPSRKVVSAFDPPHITTDPYTNKSNNQSNWTDLPIKINYWPPYFMVKSYDILIFRGQIARDRLLPAGVQRSRHPGSGRCRAGDPRSGARALAWGRLARWGGRCGGRLAASPEVRESLHGINLSIFILSRFISIIGGSPTAGWFKGENLDLKWMIGWGIPPFVEIPMHRR